MTMSPDSIISRRSALFGASAAGLGLAGLMRSAAGAYPGDRVVYVPQIIQDWAAAAMAEDADRYVALFTPDAFFESIPIGEVTNGTEELWQANQAQFDAYSDITVDIACAFQSGNWIVAEGVYGGVYAGQIAGVPPGTGQLVSIRFLSIFELRGGLICRESDYYDGYSLFSQLGAFDATATDASLSS
jgi:steroid delta-isomerase-like uncharacterized protein